MKKFIIFAAIAVSAAVASTFVVSLKMDESNLKVIFTESVESLARDESAEDVVCKCPRFFGGTCKASHAGNTCASGHNVRCWDWDGNC